jgi:hypothetical protein
MSEDEITYRDVREYESLFTLTPSFLLERFAKKNANLALKYESVIRGHLSKMNGEQKRKLDIILNSETDHLQKIMAKAYEISKKKQYKILANPEYSQFIEDNLSEIRKMVE